MVFRVKYFNALNSVVFKIAILGIQLLLKFKYLPLICFL